MENRPEVDQSSAPLRPHGIPVDGSNFTPPYALNRPVHRPGGMAALGRPPPVSTPPGPSQAKRARKDRGPNWLPQEILVLIRARREMYLEELHTVDGRDLMTADTTKWMRISQDMMRAGFSPCLRDGPACKAKWNQLIPDYKRIADYLSRTGRNIPDYWELSSAERKAEGLPRMFAKEFYDAIHEWYSNRPQIQPPHVRDLLAPNDSNYHPQAQQHQQEGEEDSDADQEEAYDNPVQEAFESTDASSQPRSPQRSSSTAAQEGRSPATGGSPGTRPFTGVPPGVTPHVLSSSDNTHFSGHRRPGNTAVRRKNLSGHSVIAEATKATGAAMASQMLEIADASRELERSKIEVQLKLFTEQMAYQREKDRRMYEHASIANDNARMAIIKQGEMVACLSQLLTVLGHGLSMQNTHSFDNMGPGGFHKFGTSNQGFASPGGQRFPTPGGQSFTPTGHPITRNAEHVPPPSTTM
ncbi:hypothetical protein M758_UG083900 [Ceratodon purpureus]|nr:hypothetical protein M758_UG083900 [Ceratodon purpureus]